MYDPFFFPGNDHGVLLIHGFSGGPFEMRELGVRLAHANHTVLGMRLPGHADPLDALAAIQWHDWLIAVRHAYADLATRCNHVSVVGFSLGGALALLLAAEQPIHRLSLLATPLWLMGDWRINLLAVVRHVIPWFYPLEHADFSDPAVRAQVHARQPDLDLDNPAIQAALRRGVRLSIGALDELRRTLAHARRSVPHVTAPTLIMHGRADTVAPISSADHLIRHLSSADRRLIWWEQTGHQLLTEGPHRQAIQQHVADFLHT